MVPQQVGSEVALQGTASAGRELLSAVALDISNTSPSLRSPWLAGLEQETLVSTMTYACRPGTMGSH